MTCNIFIVDEGYRVVYTADELNGRIVFHCKTLDEAYYITDIPTTFHLSGVDDEAE
jgi:hypothetical protein